MKPEVLLENDVFIAINKPSGLLSIPDREGKEVSLKTMLEAKLGKIFTVHRLDKDTSGVIVFAKDEQTHKQLSKLFEGRAVEKFYVGLVNGMVYQQEGTIEAGIMEHPVKKGWMVTHQKGKAAVTDYKVLESFRLFSWMQFQIHTGRTHQIRVHMKHIGHIIVCDDLYGVGKPILLSEIKRNFKLSKLQEEEKPLLARLALHSWKLRFTLNNQDFEIEAEVPKDLRAVLQQLRKWKA
jgi:23S rRNA pseudouridine1911/1915/1917 synthase